MGRRTKPSPSNRSGMVKSSGTKPTSPPRTFARTRNLIKAIGDCCREVADSIKGRKGMIDHSAGLDLMVQDIERQSPVLRSSLGPLRERSSEIVDRLGRGHPSVYLVGCGDSHDAGLAAQYEWEQLVNLPVRAMPAM